MISKDFDLFKTLQSGASLETAANDWTKEYKESAQSAILFLFNFILKACGSDSEILDFSLLESELPETISNIQNSQLPTSSYPIIAKKSSLKNSSKFKSNLYDFFSKVIAKLLALKDSPIYLTDNSFDILKNILINLASSSFRPFRHTSTCIVLAIVNRLCLAANHVNKDWSLYNSELLRSDATEKKDLQDQIDKISKKKEALELHLSDFFDGVYIHRYRDIDSAIRMDCIKELGMWMTIYPELYLDPTYLRYIGWMLSDSCPTVRIESVKALNKLYGNPQWTSSLRQFTERFKSRICEMALRECNSGVKTQCVHLVLKIANIGFMDNNEMKNIYVLLFTEDSRARDSVAEYIGSVWGEEICSAAVEDAIIDCGNENLNETWIQFKALANFVIDICKSIRTLNQSDQHDGEQISNSDNPGKNSQESSLFFSNESFEGASFELEDDIGDHFQNLLLKIIASRKELHNWGRLLEDMRPFNNPDLLEIGCDNILLAVRALWDHIDLIKGFPDLLQYLSSDLSIPLLGSVSTSELSLAKAYSLSESEELCLFYILSACVLVQIERLTEEPRKRGSNNEEPSKSIIPFILKLLKKYGNEQNGSGQRILIQVLRIIKTVDVKVYNLLSITKEFEALVHELNAVFMRQSNASVLVEFMFLFQHLAGISTEQRQPAKKKRGLAMESAESSITETLFNSCIQVIAESCETVTEEVYVVFGRLDESDWCNPLATDLNCSLKRLAILSRVSDLTRIEVRNLGISNLLMSLTSKLVGALGTDLYEFKSVVSESLCLVIEISTIELMYSFEKVFTNRDIPEDFVQIREKTEGFIKQLQALICDESVLGSGVIFSSVQGLSCILKCLSSDLISALDVNWDISISDITQRKAIQSFCNGLMNLVYKDPYRERVVQRILRAHPDLNVENEILSDVTSSQILVTASDLLRLIAFGHFDFIYASDIIQFFGQDHSQICFNQNLHFEFKTNIFGASSWDVVVSDIIEYCLVTRVSSIFFEFSENRNLGDAEIVESVRHEFENAGVVCLDTILKSVSLYLRGYCHGVNHSINLIKHISSVLKQWISLFTDTDDDDNDMVYLQAVCVRCLLQILRKCLDFFVDVLTGNTANPLVFELPKRSIAEIDKICTVFESFTPIVGEMCHTFGVQYEARPEDGGITSLEDIVLYISTTLASRGIKPGEDDESFVNYWHLIASLESGNVASKKFRKRKKKTTKIRKTKKQKVLSEIDENSDVEFQATDKKPRQQLQKRNDPNDDAAPIKRNLRSLRSRSPKAVDRVREDQNSLSSDEQPENDSISEMSPEDHDSENNVDLLKRKEENEAADQEEEPELFVRNVKRIKL